MKHAFFLLNLFFISVSAFSQTAVSGSWSKKEGSVITTWLFQDGFYSCTKYDIANKVFNYTKGGSYVVKGNELQMNPAFHTSEKDKVGSIETATVIVKDNVLQLTVNAVAEKYNRTDDGKGALAGHWLITGRKNNGNMQTITPGARRTIKLLTGTRFQWIAINSETKEFFGTGGGTYTFVNGKYTEHIEFFSRDSSRVGASLSFDGKVEGNNWHHSGLSSRGEPIHEIWTRRL
nr:hypothetical protein [uncultured Lacibacter sp.]